MSFANDLPDHVLRVLRTSPVSEYATVSAAGVPIDTPTFVFPNADITSLDIATGLAYPAKAERARNNPKVGLLYDALPGTAVVSVAGHAAVSDSDLQRNMDRYVSETILGPPISPSIIDWVYTRQAVWYLTRIIVQVTPVHIRWWDSLDTMDGPPQEWHAPAGTVFPSSDPVPPGKISASPQWEQPSWQDLAKRALSGEGGPGGIGFPGHLTLLDAEGYPIPIRARKIELIDGGFRLDIPKSAPWSAGKATLSFGGLENFVGDVSSSGDGFVMKVERALPILPIAQDPVQVIRPNDETKAALMGRLRQEAERRGQPIPSLPETPPEPSAGALVRAQAMAEMMASLPPTTQDGLSAH